MHFQHFGNQIWTLAGTKKGNQNGPPNWACIKGIFMFERKSGGPFWVPFFGVSGPSQRACRRGPVDRYFASVCQLQGRSAGSEGKLPLSTHGRVCSADRITRCSGSRDGLQGGSLWAPSVLGPEMWWGGIAGMRARVSCCIHSCCVPIVSDSEHALQVLHCCSYSRCVTRTRAF